MKLSTNQKEVIRLMRDGHKCTLLGCNGVVLTWTEQSDLVEQGLIYERQLFRYSLTDLGKTIEL